VFVVLKYDADEVTFQHGSESAKIETFY